jgi:hypothetical protein
VARTEGPAQAIGGPLEISGPAGEQNALPLAQQRNSFRWPVDGLTDRRRSQRLKKGSIAQSLLGNSDRSLQKDGVDPLGDEADIPRAEKPDF